MSEPTRMESSPVPVVVEPTKDSSATGHAHANEILDEMEEQIEMLRSQAAYLEDEKDGIATALDSFRQSSYLELLTEDRREEIILQLDRLSLRVSSVHVAVRTIRDPPQEEALSEVNDLINRLVGEIDRDADMAKVQCMRFLNTCASDPESGPTDKSFESALLGCTVDDQKRIRKRLQGLLNYLNGIGKPVL